MKKYLCCIVFLFCVFAASTVKAQHDHSAERSFLDHELIFTNIQGDTIALSEMTGKVVFINMWATWCGPCRDEMPTLNHLYLRYKNSEHVQFLFVDADNNLKKAQKFLQKKNYQLPLYASVNGFPASLFRGALPTTMVFDRRGKLVMHYEGAADYSNENFIQAFDRFIQEH